MVLDLNGDIRLLLSAGNNIMDVKAILTDLTESMTKMENNCDYYKRSALTVRNFMAFFDDMQRQALAAGSGHKLSIRRKKKRSTGEELEPSPDGLRDSSLIRV